MVSLFEISIMRHCCRQYTKGQWCSPPNICFAAILVSLVLILGKPDALRCSISLSLSLSMFVLISNQAYESCFRDNPFEGFGIFSYAFGLGFLRLLFLSWCWEQQAPRPRPRNWLGGFSPGLPLRPWILCEALTLLAWLWDSLSLSESDELELEDSDSELLSPTGRDLW